MTSPVMTTSADIPDAPRAMVPPLRVALVHDWLTGMRGGEKVLEMLCERFPTAPLWTLLHVPGSVTPLIAQRKIHTSLLQAMPHAKEKYRHYLPFFPLFAELNKVEDADLVISTSHAVAKSMVKRSFRNKPVHICYIHTPMRYAWDLFDEYFGPERVGWFASKFVFKPVMQALQVYDRLTVGRVDLFVANSRYVAERVKRIYGREAEVLSPPVDTERFLDVLREAGDTYLVVSALVPYKRVDHAIRACAAMGRKLCIVGQGPELDNLRALATQRGGQVDFVGFATDAELADHYRTARALLFPGLEDFGIVPVEAIACGCPVVALGVGGILDSMTNETAVFYRESNAEALADAIAIFEGRESEFDEAQLRAQARIFSRANFRLAFEATLQRMSRQAVAAKRYPITNRAPRIA